MRISQSSRGTVHHTVHQRMMGAPLHLQHARKCSVREGSRDVDFAELPPDYFNLEIARIKLVHGPALQEHLAGPVFEMVAREFKRFRPRFICSGIVGLVAVLSPLVLSVIVSRSPFEFAAVSLVTVILGFGAILYMLVRDRHHGAIISKKIFQARIIERIDSNAKKALDDLRTHTEGTQDQQRYRALLKDLVHGYASPRFARCYLTLDDFDEVVSRTTDVLQFTLTK